jgi:hypothetical protein
MVYKHSEIQVISDCDVQYAAPGAALLCQGPVYISIVSFGASVAATEASTTERETKTAESCIALVKCGICGGVEDAGDETGCRKSQHCDSGFCREISGVLLVIFVQFGIECHVRRQIHGW